MTLASDMAHELRNAANKENFIYAGSLEPDKDLIPVPRYIVETAAEALGLLEKQVQTLRTIAANVATVLEEIVQRTPELAGTPHGLSILQTAEKVKRMQAAT